MFAATGASIAIGTSIAIRAFVATRASIAIGASLVYIAFRAAWYTACAMYIIFCLSSIIVLVGIDHFLKLLTITFLEYNEPYAFIPGFVNFTYIRNPGAAFGIFEDNKIMIVILPAILLSIGVILLITRVIKDRPLIVCAVMIISGGLANLLDRIMRGSVVDYIDLDFAPFKSFPIFNFADCLVVIGAFTVLFYICICEPLKNRKTSRKDQGRRNA